MPTTTVTFRRVAHVPDARAVRRFVVAPFLTCAIFLPFLGAGLFGAPTMLAMLIPAWLMLRAGWDDFGSFAAAGLVAGFATLAVVSKVAPQAATLFVAASCSGRRWP